MARLTDMLGTKEESTVEVTTEETTNHLAEALQVLIDMINENALTADEIEVLEDAITFVTETEEELTEKKMTQQAKMAARKYRLKNKGKLALIAKKKKACMAKIAGKTDKLACGSDGRPHVIDKARSKAARLGAKSR